MVSRPSAGFTLPELATVLAITGLVGALALPAMGEAIARYRLHAAADDLLDALRLARATALWRDHRVYVCPPRADLTCSLRGDWTSGWIVRDLPTGKIITSSARLARKIRALRTPGRHGFSFDGRGAAFGTNQRIVLCVAGRPATSLAVVVGNAGRVHRDVAKPDEAASCARARSGQP